LQPLCCVRGGGGLSVSDHSGHDRSSLLLCRCNDTGGTVTMIGVSPLVNDCRWYDAVAVDPQLASASGAARLRVVAVGQQPTDRLLSPPGPRTARSFFQGSVLLSNGR